MEQNWCNTPRVSLLGLVLLSCSIFLFHVISAQHSLSYPWDLARIMPAWHHPLEAFPACPGAAVGAGSELVGAVGHGLPPQSLHTAGGEAGPSTGFEAAEILPHTQVRCSLLRAWAVFPELFYLEA